MERAHHGALSPRGRRRDVSGALPPGGPDQKRAPHGLGRRARHLHLSRTAGGGRRRAHLSPTDDVARGGLSPTVAPPCPGAADPRRPVVWAVSPHAGGGPRGLPRRAWATAGGDAGSADLADRMCLAWGSPSRAVSYLRAAARVHGCHPAWRCAPAYTGWGVRGMKPTHARRQGEIGQGWGLSGGGPVVSRRGQEHGLGDSAG